jgi:hypothetical protein
MKILSYQRATSKYPQHFFWFSDLTLFLQEKIREFASDS